MTSRPVAGESPFLKRVLIPFWVIRDLIMVLEIGLYVLAIGVIAANKNDIDTKLRKSYNTTYSASTVLAILVVVMLIILLCLILDIVCIIKRARRTLTPRFFLIISVIQTVFWTVMFVLNMIGARTGILVGINILIYLSCIGLLIYASVVFHRHRRNAVRGTYASALNPVQQPNLAYNADHPSYPATAYGEQPGPKPAYYEMQNQQGLPYGYPNQHGP